MKLLAHFCSLLFFLFVGSANGQNTIGVLLNSDEAFQGFTLYNPISYTSTYLIDNCGRVRNEWISEFTPGISAYLINNGELLRSGRIANGNSFTGPGSGGALELFDWDGNLIWSAILNADTLGFHHDIAPMPDGSILLTAWEKFSKAQAIQAGKDSTSFDGDVWSTAIYQIVPNGTNDFEVIWEWHLWEHLVQNFDSTKDNFGDPELSPRKLDINHGLIADRNWIHANGLWYDEERDEIVISSRNFNEIWIVDHSTTTQEAANEVGGTAGFGGDLLFRWGNNATFLPDSNSNQFLFGQHNAKYLPAVFGEDRVIQIFNNNRGIADFSEIVSIKPAFDSQSQYVLNEAFEIIGNPSIFASGDTFDSEIMSNVQSLPNNHLLINAGATGDIFEFDEYGEIVWRYRGPVSLFGPNEQGSTVNGSLFTAFKFDVNDPIFEDLDVSIKADAIELNPTNQNCLLSEINEPLAEVDLMVYPTLFDNLVNIESNNRIYKMELIGNAHFEIIEIDSLASRHQLFLPNLANGIYFIKMYLADRVVVKKIIKINN